jgi:outer membrane protein assembly factor BamB
MNKYFTMLACATVLVMVSGCSYVPSWAGGEVAEKEILAGKRVTVLPDINALQPDTAARNAPMNFSKAIANDNWPQHGGNFSAQNGNLSAAGNFDSVTRKSVGDGESFESTAVISPVVGGGLVFAMDQEGVVSAHDANDIDNVRWKYSGAIEEDAPVAIGGGLAYDQGVIYVLSGRGVVAAVDTTTGNEKWRKAMRVPFRSAPKVAGGKLFATTIDNQLFAINTTDGNVAWSHRGINESAGLMNTVSPTLEGNVVIVPYASAEIYVLSQADGKEIWSESLSAGKHTQANALLAGIGGNPVVDGGVVFAVSSGGTITAKALMTGQRVWERSVGGINTPWLAGDRLFMLTSDNMLVSFVKYDGKVQWVTPLQSYEDMDDKKDPISWKGPVMVDGKLAVVGSNGELLMVSAQDGSIVATKSIPDDIYTAPVVAGGRMYLVRQDSTLYCLK